MLVGQTIGNPAKGTIYIEKELGSGAMGTVYRAKLTTADGKVRPAALKIVSLGLVGNESAMKRFDRESLILQQLKHPHIVRLFGTGRYRGTPYIAMEFVDGEPMDRALVRRGRLGWEEVFGYGKQLCEALQHAHEKGIIHRDLKPSNLMITKTGVLKLTDFGIAKDTDVTALTAANSTIGTSAYMSPEQCRGSKELSAKSDLYSLGVCLYELISGKKPFYAENTMDMFLKHVNEAPVRLGKLMPDLPVWVDNLVMHLLEKSPDTRPYDAITVKRMMEEIEHKVQNQQSAGLDVATARKVDRKLNDTANVTAADRDAARAIKGKKKKKKKAVPLFQQTWVKAAGLGAVLAALLGVGLWISWGVMFPSPESALAALKAAPEEGKREVALDFLKQFGKADSPAVAEAKGIFKAAQTKYIETTIVNRAGSGKLNRRKADEGEDPEVMRNIFAAIDAERDGRSAAARDNWKFVRDKVPEPDWTQVGDKDAFRYTPNKWVAEKRLADLDTAARKPKELEERISTARTSEEAPYPDTSSADGRAAKAIRLEQFGDTTKAHRTWDALAAVVIDAPDKLPWLILAADRRVSTKPDKEAEANAPAKRAELVRAAVAKAFADWEKVKDDRLATVARRDVRITCREVIDLYDDDTEDAIKPQVAAARTLLEQASK